MIEKAQQAAVSSSVRGEFRHTRTGGPARQASESLSAARGSRGEPAVDVWARGVEQIYGDAIDIRELACRAGQSAPNAKLASFSYKSLSCRP
jgi:hypothetical protein